MRPLKALINIDNARKNLSFVRSLAPSSKIMATMKANAYGHGLNYMASAFSEADGFSVLTINEAVELRESGYEKKILLLEGVFDKEDLKIAAAFNFDVVLHNDYQLSLIRQLSSKKKISVHLKVNTGMNRLGFSLNNLPKVHSFLKEDERISEIVLMSHFANADSAKGIESQLSEVKMLRSNYHEPFSVANSAAILNNQDTHLEWIRPGIMLYGANPFDLDDLPGGLLPVMTLRSEIIATQEIKKGDGVGYGSDFRAPNDMRIGIVACGYADGYPRHAPSGTPIFVDGVETQTVGRVSMDMIAVDITSLLNTNIGSSVELWGENLGVDRVARSANTVGYELLCAISSPSRVPVEIYYG